MASPEKPLVTVLCGFLGAGKTTLLNHLLGQAEGRRWAAVVNDVAAINIDGALVQAASNPAEDGKIVELGNGCVCCSSRDELAETIAELASGGRYEHILVETTGVAEPRSLAALFVQKNPFGRSLSDFAQLSALVSVIDAAHFGREWKERQKNAGAVEPQPGGKRPVFELMIEQVECADVLVLNKCDLVEAEALAGIVDILRGLNERAEIVRAERAQVASEFLLERVRFDPKETLGAARWLRLLNAVDKVEPGPRDKMGAGVLSAAEQARHRTALHAERFGIGSFVFQARQPFVQEKLRGWLEKGVSGLLRAKGFFWVKERPDEMGFMSIAGGVLRYDFLNYWWAAMVESGKVSRGDVPAILEKSWVEPAGDRRQELVFIGVDLDEDAIRAALADCFG